MSDGVPALSEMVIAPEDGESGRRRRSGASTKGRGFSAICLCHVEAEGLWWGGSHDCKDRHRRPVFACFAGTDDELRPFVANLILGRKAVAVSARDDAGGLEFLKSAGYRVSWQRHDIGTVATVYLPEVFALDPGMVDPKEARFVLLPPSRWAVDQARDLPFGEMVAHAKALPLVRRVNTPPEREWERQHFTAPLPDARLAELAPLAYLFAAYLDRRTRAPIVADGRFYLQLLLACLHAPYGEVPLASLSCGRSYSWSRDEGFGHSPSLGYSETGVAEAGFLPGVAFRGKHAMVEALLATEVETYFAVLSGDPAAIWKLEAERAARREEAVRKQFEKATGTEEVEEEAEVDDEDDEDEDGSDVEEDAEDAA